MTRKRTISRTGLLSGTGHTYHKDKRCEILYSVSDRYGEELYLSGSA